MTSAWTSDWAPDPDVLHTGTGTGTTADQAGVGVEEHPETRPVPTHWTATGRRSATAPPDLSADQDDAVVSIPGPAAVPAPARDTDEAPARYTDQDDYDDYDDYDDDDDLRETAAERTEVIWRAPGLDTHVAPAPAPGPADDAHPDLSVTGPAPYTGARPRRFAAAPTAAPVVAEPESPEPAEEGPGTGRVRIVLSERRSTAHSSRRLSDVQDPGTVGTLLRNSLVRTQLLLALRVSLVALFGLGVLPALFMAVPALGTIEIIGIRLPWLVLGVLVYPFLLGLGWWYVRSSEAAEQEFAEDVADR